MTQKERQDRSKNEILQAAKCEFGAHDYDSVTMESICSRHGISKGMMYYYYSNKDDLFLLCVEDTFLSLREYLAVEIQKQPQNSLRAVKDFFMKRETFFDQYPQQKRIFENAVIRPPKHLEAAIQTIRQPIRELNHQFLHHVVTHMPVREGLNAEDVTRYLESFEVVFRTFLEQYCREGKITDAHSMLEVTEEILDMLFLGIIQ